MEAVAEPTSNGALHADPSQARRPPRPRRTPRRSLDRFGRQPAGGEKLQVRESRAGPDGSPRSRLGLICRHLDKNWLRHRSQWTLRP